MKDYARVDSHPCLSCRRMTTKPGAWCWDCWESETRDPFAFWRGFFLTVAVIGGFVAAGVVVWGVFA